ncbi:hypothetical protein K4K54_009671 [Colletotrichum sp. SAR 10_86]|nr:hypothetical protein KHU50_012029 [Colletotrichum sp. SAR 10_65]KAI8173838.1 hypothetical protein K4K51_009404 [Colletotrichum sp. SAR 10_75]KAI8219271.1 hypothetical protein K4K54_009671 [Colletotrichum sp. SAR 10_86]
MFPDTYGVISGCFICNDKGHVIYECATEVARELFSDPQALYELFVRDRGNKPPGRLNIPWVEWVPLIESGLIIPAKYKGGPFPWTRKFTQKMRDGKYEVDGKVVRIWENYDYKAENTQLPSDPATASFDAIMENHDKLLDSEVDKLRGDKLAAYKRQLYYDSDDDESTDANSKEAHSKYADPGGNDLDDEDSKDISLRVAIPKHDDSNDEDSKDFGPRAAISEHDDLDHEDAKDECLREVESKGTGSDVTGAGEVIVKEEEWTETASDHTNARVTVKEEEWTDTESEITDAEEVAVEEDE